MLLTIITIIFLPLSFVSSIFGMNAVEFDSGSNQQPWNSSIVENNATILSSNSGDGIDIRAILTYLFPVSLLVILLSITLAFSTWIRSGLYAASIILWAAVFEYTRIRQFSLWVIGKLGLSETLRKGDGFYTKGAMVKRTLYDRKNRDEMMKAWAIAKEKDMETCGSKIDNGIKKRRGIRRWMKGDRNNDIDGRGIGASDDIIIEDTIGDKV
jgi:hypothetical protein